MDGNGKTLYVRLAAHLGDLRSDLTRGAGYVQAYGKKVDAQMASLDRYAEKNKAGLRSLGTGFGVMGGAAALGIGVAVKKFAEFDKQMSAVQAATHASQSEMAALRSEAIKLGADTAFSATEAAQGIEELAKAGVSTHDILNGALKGSLDLAAAGDLSVAQAAEIAATAKTQFDLLGSDVPHLADLLAAGAGKAQGSVQDLGAALGQTGLIASGMGLSIEDTTGTLAAFASAGLIGSDAGTAFKTMIQRLQAPMGRGAMAMNEYGISAYDAQGKFVGITDVADQLRDKLGHLTAQQRDAALAQMFGSDAIRAATVLYKQGGDGIQGWINKTNDAGYAAETARLKTDNLAGDIERLGGSLDSFLIGMGAGANGPMREFVQMLEGIVDLAGAVPAPIMSAAVAGLALAAALGLTVFAATRMIGAVGATRASLQLLKAQAVGTAESLYLMDRAALFKNIGKGAAMIGGMALASGALGDGFGMSNTAAFALMGTVAGPFGVAMGAATGLVLDLGQASSAMGAEFEAAREKLETAPNMAGQIAALEQLKKERKELLQESMNPMEAFSVGLRGIMGKKSIFAEQREQVEEASKAVVNYQSAVSAMFSRTFDKEQSKLFSKDYSIKELQSFVDEVTPILSKAGLDAQKVFAEGVSGKHWDEAAASINEFRYAQESAAGRAAALDEALALTDQAILSTSMSTKDLKEALDGLFAPTMDLDAAVQKYRDGLASLRGELQKNGTTLDNDTVKGRANREVIRGRIDDLLGQVTASSAAGKSAEYMANMIERGRQKIIEQATAAGIGEEAITELLNQYNLTPELISTLVETPGLDDADEGVTALGVKVGALDGSTANISVDLATGGAQGVLNGLSVGLGNLDGKKADIKVELATGGAQGVLNGLLVGMNTLNGKKSTITVITKKKTESDAFGSFKPGSGRGTPIVPRYAGGMYNDAHIVRGGIPKAMYGEPETQGEAYIPFAQDRRKRSTEILGKTANRFGYDLAPRGTQAAGRGGGTTVVHQYDGPLVSGLTMPVMPGQTPDSMIRPLVYELRRVKRGGKYNR